MRKDPSKTRKDPRVATYVEFLGSLRILLGSLRIARPVRQCVRTPEFSGVLTHWRLTVWHSPTQFSRPTYRVVSISNLQQLKSAGFSCLSVFAVKNIFLIEDVHRKLPEVEVCRIALSIFAFFNSIFQSKTLHFEICRVFLAIFAFKSIFQCKISLENFQSLKSAGLSCPSVFAFENNFPFRISIGNFQKLKSAGLSRPCLHPIFFQTNFSIVVPVVSEPWVASRPLGPNKY